MEPPIYLIKSRSGDTLIQGTAEQVSSWFKDQRFSSKDELRRQGWVLYEKDQAWALIEAFPEISGPSAHERLKEQKKRNVVLLLVSLILSVFGISMISLSQLLPAYDASRRIEESAELANRAVASAKLAAVAKSEAEFTTKTALDALEAQKRLVLAAENKLEEQVEKSEQLAVIVKGLEKRMDEAAKSMPIVVRWRESLINKNQVVVVTNCSAKPLKLLVSVYDQGSTQPKRQFSLNLGPVGLNGSTKESGIGESVAHYFKVGETVEFVDVDSGKDYRFTPVRSTAP